MNILITGSSGFIGSALARKFSGEETIGLDRVFYPGERICNHTYCVDITSRTALSNALMDVKRRIGTKLDCVFHLAAYYDFSNKKDPLYERVNEVGTRNLLEALEDFEVGSFIFTSSTAVMKGLSVSAPDTTLDVSSPLGSLLEYGESKRRAEEIVLDFKDRFKVFIVRLGGVYAMECRLIPLAHQIASIYRRDLGSRFLPANGHGCVAYVHIEDVLNGLEKLAMRRNQIPSGSIYILSEDDYLPYAELYGLIHQYIHGGNGNHRPISLPTWLLKGGVQAMGYLSYIKGRQGYFFRPWMVSQSLLRYCFDTEKTKRELGWNTKYLLRDYIEEILKGLKADPEKWFRLNNIHL